MKNADVSDSSITTPSEDSPILSPGNSANLRSKKEKKRKPHRRRSRKIHFRNHETTENHLAVQPDEVIMSEDQGRGDSKRKFHGGELEDLTKEITVFLANPFHKNLIRFHKDVITPICTAKSCKANSTVALLSGRDDHIKTKPISEKVLTPLHHASPQSTEAISTPVVNGNDGGGHLVFCNDNHEELVRKICELQLVVDDLKGKAPFRINSYENQLHGNIEYNEEMEMKNKFLAEKERNKLRMRRRKEEDAKEGNNMLTQTIYDSLDAEPITINDELRAERARNKERMRLRQKRKEEEEDGNSTDLTSVTTTCDASHKSSSMDEKNRPRSSSRRQRLSRKKEIWKRYSRRNRSQSGDETSVTDVSSVMSHDDLENPSNGYFHRNLNGHSHDVLPGGNVQQPPNGPFLPHNDSSSHQIPPLQPYPPYSNAVYAMADPLPVPPSSMLYHQPPFGNPYVNMYASTPQRASNYPNNLPPKFPINMMRQTSTEQAEANIVLPSGRGRARQTERVLEETDLGKLEKAQEQARMKMKAFLDQHDTGNASDQTACDESVT